MVMAESGPRNLSRSDLLGALVDQSRLDFVLIDHDARFVLANRAFAEHAGIALDKLVGQRYEEVFSPVAGAARDILPYLAEAWRARAPIRIPAQLFDIPPLDSGDTAGAEWLFEPILDDQGEVAFLACFHDGTTTSPGAQTLTRLNRALRLLSACNAALIHADREQRLLETICRLIVEVGGYPMAWVGFSEAEQGGRLRPVGHAGIEYAFLHDVVIRWWDTPENGGPAGEAVRSGATQVVQNFAGENGQYPWQTAAEQRGYRSCIALPLVDQQNTFGALTIYSGLAGAFSPQEIELLEELSNDLAYGICSLRTRARREQAEDRLVYLSEHDPLTGLPNRPLLRDRFDRAASQASREHSSVALLYLDLDHFKQINDALGHVVGDRLLIALIDRLRQCIRDTDTISRQGGDEFVILLTDIRDPAIVSRIAQEILAAIAEPFEIDGTSLTTTFSIGISLFPADGENFDTLLKQADSALYQAKDAGRNTYSFFSTQMNVDAMARMQLQNSLRAAIRNNEFKLHYQPQVDIGNGRIVGVEALIRWLRPDGVLVPPSDFIPAAEQSGLIIPIGEWVMREACRQAANWRLAGLPPVKMAVNLSAVQLKRGNIVETVSAALEYSGLPPSWLELELTESVLVHDVDAVMRTLGALKELGVQLSIDDFGTGYSSLSYLKRLAVDKLKIDHSFVRDLVTDSEDAAIVNAIIQLGRSLQLSVIAEGVETETQLAFLHRAECNEMQGFLFSRPVPAADLETLLQEGRTLALPSPEEDSLRTILLVDDEEAILSALSRALHRDGYRILRAAGGAAALEMLAGHRVDLIISDHMMPGMTGVDLLRRAKQLYPDVLRIMLSAYANLDVVIEANNNGVFHRFLTKPWDDAQLRAHVKEAFQQITMKREHARMQQAAVSSSQTPPSGGTRSAAGL
jgi:diguanylate cyclase (GGDEF)-like protein